MFDQWFWFNVWLVSRLKAKGKCRAICYDPDKPLLCSAHLQWTKGPAAAVGSPVAAVGGPVVGAPPILLDEIPKVYSFCLDVWI